jgi:hypothetical protein
MPPKGSAWWTVAETAKAWKCTMPTVRRLAPEVPGATQAGIHWLIPAGTKRPKRALGRPPLPVTPVTRRAAKSPKAKGKRQA